MSDCVLPAVPAPVPGEATTGLEIRLFGPMAVRIGSCPLPRLRSRKGLWLLGLLTLRAGRHVERDWLAGMLWPDSTQADSRRSLRQSLHDLRLALGPEAGRLTGEAPQMLRLDLCGAFVDVLAFDAAHTRGDLDSLEAAVRLYRGPFLEDCTEAWCLEERRRREQTYLAALERLAAAATAREEYAAAASWLQRAVGADPYREDLQRALMEALAAGDNPSGALLAYRQFRALLGREMAAEPTEATTALFRRLREETRARRRLLTPQPPAPAPLPFPAAPGAREGGGMSRKREPSRPQGARSGGAGGVPAQRVLGSRDMSPGHLPQPLSAFVGRERELLDVGACLTSARLVTLTGPGGIGKTRLAIRVAEECAWEFAAGAWFVDLAALADAALVPQAVARALRVPEAPDSPLAETLQEALSARQFLLVLDNCEHVIDACARLADALLSCCPHLRILATSRQALGLTGEVSWPVAPLSLPPAHGVGSESSPDTLLQYEAIHLLVERAAAAVSGFALDESSAAAAVQVCRRLDGIPLAIELAAARLKVLPVEQIAARLDDRFRLLTGGSRGALPRQQTLRATLDWSYELLPEPERLLLRRLSVFAGGFTLEAAESVCADHGLLDLLTQLVEKSLVGVERRGGAARYVLLETTRNYARERLWEAGEGEEQRARHAQYFLALAERAAPELRGAAQAEWLRRLEEDHDNFRAALDWCLKAVDSGQWLVGSATEAGWKTETSLSGLATNHPPASRVPAPTAAVELGLRLGGVLGWFWWMRGYMSEGRERLQALLSLSGYTIGASEPGRETEVARPMEDSRHPGSRQPRVRLAEAKALNVAGMLADDQSDYAAARALFEESLALCREFGDQWGAAMALNNLGGQALQARDYPTARAQYEQSLAIWREIGDQWGTAAALTNLGRVALIAGEYATISALVESALEIQRQLRDRRAIARSLTTLGITAARLGDYEAAHALHEESLSIVRELGAKQAIEETLCALGSIADARGDHDAALAFHEERLTIAREMGSEWGMADSLYYLGLLARDRGEIGRAGTLWAESIAISQRLGDRHYVAECLEAFASLARPPGTGDNGSCESRQTGDGPDRALWAARLFGAAAVLRELVSAPVPARRPAEYERQITAARAMLDAATFDAAWADGRAMTPDQAIAYALRGAGVVTVDDTGPGRHL
jgi:predicted ATPase/DNA-binding SARP family transcriptional activator